MALDGLTRFLFQSNYFPNCHFLTQELLRKGAKIKGFCLHYTPEKPKQSYRHGRAGQPGP